MSDSSPSSSSPEIQINIKGPNELKLQISISLEKTVAELKQAIAAKSDVEANRQRLIYSGRVLKDEDALSVYKVQSAHTIHMVKGAARAAGSSSASAGGSSGVTAQQLPSMQAGQNPTDPLTVLNGPMGHGLMAGFNPFADMGLNTNDPNMMQNMLQNPAILQQMSSLMSNPALIDSIIASNPQLQAMPQVRQIMQSEAFRNMMANPEALQSMMRMSALLQGSGLGGAGGMGGLGGLGAAFGGSGGGAGAFPAPGLPSYAQGQGQAPTSPSGTQSQSSGGGTPFNPSLYPPFPPASPSTTSTTPSTSSSTPASPGGADSAGAGAGVGGQQNPYTALSSLFGSMGGGTPHPSGGGASPFGLIDPALVNSLLGGMGGTGTNPGVGANFGGGLGGLGGFASPAPTDTRPPEERFQVQLQQLQDMGFTNASQNVRALLATGGNVHTAIEYILNGGGL